jgi:hypothetical protein
MVFFQEDLATARQALVEAPMLPLSLANGQFINLVREIGRGVKAHLFRTYTQYGVAQIITTKTTEVPLIDDSSEEYLVRVFPIRAAFQLEEDELELAAATGQSPSTRKLLQARNVIERELDLIAFEGRTDTTLLGMGNNPNVTVINFPANGNENGQTNSVSWANKSAQQILDDLNTVALQIQTQTANTVFATRLMMPSSKLNQISTKTFNANGDSVLTIFLRNQASLPNGGIRDIVGHPALETAGTGGVGRIVAYDSGSDGNRLHIPQGGDFRDMNPETRGTTVKITCQMKTAGVEIERIKEVVYANVA